MSEHEPAACEVINLDSIREQKAAKQVLSSLGVTNDERIRLGHLYDQSAYSQANFHTDPNHPAPEHGDISF